jgi:hypothetical protein
MRKLCFGAIALCLLTTGVTAVRAEADKESQAVLDKAIQAAGGETKLANLKAVTCKTKITSQAGLEVFNLSFHLTFSGVDKFHCAGEFLSLMMVGGLTPEACWRKLGDKLEDARPDAAQSVRKVLYAVRTAEMLLPLKDPALTLVYGGETKAGDRPAFLVTATHKDHGQIRFFFDKETGLPAKVEARTQLGPANQECPFECTFADYKDVEGVKHCTKINITTEVGADAITVELLLSDVKALTGLKEELFARPE